jgi:integrase
MLAGLRRGELAALRWDDVDLKHNVLGVERSYDYDERAYRPTKSRYGVRKVPITRTLAPYLREHALRTGRRAGLVFGDTPDAPFAQNGPQRRADGAWEDAGHERVTLHQCRHLFASRSIAAGINAHALCGYMGHSSIAVTYDLYGHMFPGNEAEAATLMDAYLDRAFVTCVAATSS